MDREKVIKELHDARRYLEDREWVDKSVGMHIDAMNDAIALLKQEAVEPIPPTDESDLWRCGNCNHQLFKCTHQRYCEMCGRAVKWNA